MVHNMDICRGEVVVLWQEKFIKCQISIQVGVYKDICLITPIQSDRKHLLEGRKTTFCCIIVEKHNMFAYFQRWWIVEFLVERKDVSFWHVNLEIFFDVVDEKRGRQGD